MAYDPSHLPPEAIDWWLSLRELPDRLRRVHRWLAVDNPPSPAADHQLHVVPTSVVCMAGAARLSAGSRRLDLAPGDAVIIQPGAWHRHESLRRGSLVFQQGVIHGRSDFWFVTRERELIASVPEQPSHTLLSRAAHEADPERRRAIMVDLLRNLARETAEPLRAVHPAVARMDAMLWRLASEPGGAEDIIGAAGIGRAQAYRLFTRHHGQPPAEVLRRDRLHVAASLLAAGLPVAEVAQRCGFASRQAFSRSFRQVLGVTPGRPGRRPRAR